MQLQSLLTAFSCRNSSSSMLLDLFHLCGWVTIYHSDFSPCLEEHIKLWIPAVIWKALTVDTVSQKP